MRKVHLDKSGSGFSFKSACGRNMLRTVISANWAEFKKEKTEHQCDKCAASKQAEFNTRTDAKKLLINVA
jgi:hypothetical protein